MNEWTVLVSYGSIIIAVMFSLEAWLLIAFVLIWASACAWSVITGIPHRRFMRAVQARPDSSEYWRSEFSNDTPVVESVLVIFCEAFLFDEQDKYKFVPDDVVMFIYRSTTGPISDEMQLETLTLEIESKFGVDLHEDYYENMTLRDVVSFVLKKSRPGP